jgi:hypothetical protein
MHCCSGTTNQVHLSLHARTLHTHRCELLAVTLDLFSLLTDVFSTVEGRITAQAHLRLRQLAGELMRRGFPTEPIAVAADAVVWQAGAAATSAAATAIATAGGATGKTKTAVRARTSRAEISKAQRAAVASSVSTSSNDAAAAVAGAGEACVVVVLQGSVQALWARPAVQADSSSSSSSSSGSSSSSSSDSAAATPAPPAAAAAAPAAERQQILTAGDHCFCGDLSLLGAPDDSSQPPSQQRRGAVRVVAQEDGTKVLVIPAAEFKQFITKDHMQALRKFLF